MKKNNTARTVIALLFFCTTPQMQAQAQEGELCQGHHWTEDEANLMMKRFGEQWDDLQSWEQRAAAYLFLAHHLKLKISRVEFDRSIKEDFVTILPAEDLKVFNEKNAVPDNALEGDDAVMNYLNLK